MRPEHPDRLLPHRASLFPGEVRGRRRSPGHRRTPQRTAQGGAVQGSHVDPQRRIQHPAGEGVVPQRPAADRALSSAHPTTKTRHRRWRVFTYNKEVGPLTSLLLSPQSPSLPRYLAPLRSDQIPLLSYHDPPSLSATVSCNRTFLTMVQML